MGKINLPPAKTIKVPGFVQQFETEAGKNRKEELLKKFQFRDFLRQLVEQGQIDAGLTVTGIYLMLAQTGLIKEKKYRERYNKLATITYREDLSWNEISRRVYNQVKNWWLAL